ncbi:hypothetical protein SAMN06272771_6010 [Streptomyces sp. Ag82_O1-12]|nr:hypothetical protein SAMN06272771_6010 [Streptomyces sp. Ag82_O1-12]SOD48569.1 hypothetical protein SAMN06272727_6014 [Streptomyces sp. Ag82_G6-1]
MAENERLRLAVIIGSIRKGRFGHVAAEWPASRARLRPDFDVDLIDLATAWLPDVMSADPSTPPAPCRQGPRALAASGRRVRGGHPRAQPDLPGVPEERGSRADYAALAAYSWTPREPLRTPVTVLCGDADPVVSVQEASGWRAFTRAETEVRVFPGGHFSVDRRLDDVAEVVLRGVRSASAARAGNDARHD